MLLQLVVLGFFFLCWVGFFKLLATNQGPGPEEWTKSLHSSGDAECDLSPRMGGSGIPDFSRLAHPTGALGACSSRSCQNRAKPCSVNSNKIRQKIWAPEPQECLCSDSSWFQSAQEQTFHGCRLEIISPLFSLFFTLFLLSPVITHLISFTSAFVLFPLVLRRHFISFPFFQALKAFLLNSGAFSTWNEPQLHCKNPSLISLHARSSAGIERKGGSSCLSNPPLH